MYVCECVLEMCFQESSYPWRAEKCVWSPVAGVAGGSELSDMDAVTQSWEQNLLLTAEPFLQPWCIYFDNNTLAFFI